MSQNETPKPKVQKHAKLMLVRYGRMGGMGWFEHQETHISKLNEHVVIKTERGMELGRIVGINNYRGGQFKSSPEQVETYYSNRTKDYPLGEGGTFVRFATHEDVREQEHLEKSAIGEAKCAQKLAEEHGLKMKIVEAEHLFGGERIIFYFTSEGRIDFRDLVKRLAREYQTRIELRQIGSRDEARMISDYETCGQQCCCSRYLKILEPVNMRMAKLQKATLDPSKISGHCGRLKCCLRYEDKTYLELKDTLPRRNTTVQTPDGQGKVVDVHILTQLVVVQDQMGNRKAWPVDELGEGNACKGCSKPGENRGGTKAAGQRDAVNAEAITAELEDLAQTEQEMVSPETKPKSNRNRPRSQRPKNSGSGNQQGASERKSGEKQGPEKSGENKKSRGGRNRRRRSKNKNPNSNNPQGGGNQKNKPKPQGGGNQENKPKPSGENSSQ